MKNSATIIRNASRAGLAVPAFNVPYLPMIEPILRAASDLHSAIFIEVARIEWLKFE